MSTSDHALYCICWYDHKNELRKVILWNKANIEFIKETIHQFSIEFFDKFSQSTSVDILWEEFRSLCLNCIFSIPTKSTNTSRKRPWISSHIRRLSHKKRCLYNIAKRTNSSHKCQVYQRLKKEVQQQCR